MSCQTWCNFVSKINVLICLVILRNSHLMGVEVGSMCLQMFLVCLLSSLRSRRPDPASVTQRGWQRCSGRSQAFGWDEGETWLCCCPFISEAEQSISPALLWALWGKGPLVGHGSLVQLSWGAWGTTKDSTSLWDWVIFLLPRGWMQHCSVLYACGPSLPWNSQSQMKREACWVRNQTSQSQ